MIDILYGVAAIASIVGAVFSWRYANQAKRHASQAENQIASQRRISELSQLQIRWNETYKALAIFGPGARASDLRGNNPSEPARSAQDYIEAVKRCSSSLQGIPDLDKRLEEVTPILVAFSAARSGQDLKEEGSTLLTKLSDLNSAINSVLIFDKEKVDLI